MKRNFYGSPIFIDTIWFPEAGISSKKVFLERNHIPFWVFKQKSAKEL